MAQASIPQDATQITNNSGTGYTTAATQLKYRTINNGSPISHDDVDANFEIIRSAINGVISDIDGVVDKNLTSDLSNAQLGYTESASARNYPIELGKNSSETTDTRLFVNVPWTDTTYTASGDGISLSNTNAFSHAATSTQTSSNNGGRTVIQDITLDSFGHVTGLGTATLADNNTTYTAGTGLSLSGTEFSNSAPDRTVSLTAGSNVTITGNYPDFTIASTDTNTNTITKVGTSSTNATSGTITLAGGGATTLTKNGDTITITSTDTNTDTNTITKVGVTNDLSSGNITLTGSGATTIAKSGTTITISSTDTNTVYTHPTTDGNLHVPATGTTNDGKVLTAGSTAGSLSWAHNNENYQSTTYTDQVTKSTYQYSSYGIGTWPTLQFSTVIATRSGRNAWIMGSYGLNKNYPSISNDEAFVTIDMPNSWLALNQSPGFRIHHGWHRHSTSASATAFSSTRQRNSHAEIKTITPGTVGDGIMLYIERENGRYLYQGQFYVFFLLDDTSMNS